MSSILKDYRGFSEKPLSPQQLLNLFDKLWGESARKFPKYPQVIGGISAFWRGADGVRHNAGDINEVLSAYEQGVTYDIHIEGKINDNPRCLLIYIPTRAEAIFQITASGEEIADRYIGYVEEAFPKKESPIVFVSYAGEELALADFVKEVLTRLSNGKIEVFVAKRDIPPGDNPLKVMMEEKLKSAQAIIPICSQLAKVSSWVWWESAAVWGRGYKVYPLCTNISLGDFGAPLSLVTQGRNFFEQEEFEDALKQVCSQFSISCSGSLTDLERIEYEKLQKEYSKEQTSTAVEIGFSTIEQKSELHRYSLHFDVVNRTDKAFDDIVIVLDFPEQYLEKKEWNYDHLKSSTSPGKKGYVTLTFIFSSLNETGKRQFKVSLLPRNKLRVFGEGGISLLYYQMDDERWEDRFKYSVQWKVYVNGGAPQEGSIPLELLQNY
jgi:hypothetical protein